MKIIKLKPNIIQSYNNARVINRQSSIYSTNRLYKRFNGILTTENKQNIEILQKQFKDLKPNVIREKLLEIGKQISNLFNNKSAITSGELNNRIYKQLLKIKYKQVALSSINKQELKIFPTSYTINLDNSCIDPREIKTSDRIIEHPVEVAEKILGTKNFHKNNKNKLFENESIQNLIRFKINLLAQINAYNKKQSFSNSDKNKLKNLTDKFLMIDNDLERNGIFTDNIERYLFNEINFENLAIGTKLSNSEIIVDKGEIYNHELKEKVPTITTFSKNYNHFQLITYNISSAKELESNNIKRKLEYLIRTENIDGINALNQKLKTLESINQEKIARVDFCIVNQSMLKEKMKPYSLKDIDNIDKAILIEDLENYNSKKYNNTTVKFINPLKEILLKNNLGRIFIKARSFNKTNHSPAGLYIRLGFTPLFQSKESLLDELFSKKRIRENDNIWFEYILPQN